MNPAMNMFPEPRLLLQRRDEEVQEGKAVYEFHQSNSSFFHQPEKLRPKIEKRKSAPIRFELKRSDSESQLLESEFAAEQRDYSMYVRIVNGMSNSSSRSPKSPLDSSLANVIRTRHAYANMSNPELKHNEEYGGVSTPVLSNVPTSNGEDSLAFAPRSNALHNGRLQTHLPLVETGLLSGPVCHDEFAHDDDIFDMDL